MNYISNCQQIRVTLALLFLINIVSCMSAPPLRVEGMTTTYKPNTRSQFFGQLKCNVSIGQVTFSKGARNSLIFPLDEAEFQAALEQSITTLELLANDISHVKYKLSAEVIEFVKEEDYGLIVYRLIVRYIITDMTSGSIVFDKTINAKPDILERTYIGTDPLTGKLTVSHERIRDTDKEFAKMKEGMFWGYKRAEATVALNFELFLKGIASYKQE